MSPEANEPNGGDRPGLRSTLVTLLAGILLIALLTPLSQFLTAGAGHAAVETSTPVAWAVGLIVSLVLVYGVVRVLARISIPKGHLVILYTMLTVAVPLMNLGLVRQAYVSLSSVYFEYLYYGTSTYRTAYDARDGDWFPHIPDREGLAWNRADRLLRLLTDVTAEREQNAARRELSKILDTAESLPGSMKEVPPLGPLVGKLGGDDVDLLLEGSEPATLEELGIAEALRERFEEASEESERALAEVTPLLLGKSEYAASLLPRNRENLDYSSRQRLEEQLRKLPEERKEALLAEMEALRERLPGIQRHLLNLNQSSLTELRQLLLEQELDLYDTLSKEELDDLKNSFVYRLTRSERKAMFGQDGTEGTPNLNLSGSRMGLWRDLAGQQERQRQSFTENLREVMAGIPWDLWIGPMLRWSTLFLSLFFFFMCLAEWFRRKWVDRENLAFPLVEVADNILRHDYKLETAAEVTRAEKRKELVNPLLIIGGLLGFIFLSMEAAGHYEIIGKPIVMQLDVTKEIFASGPLRDLSEVVFVLSPIVVGLLFLVNLEISFSIWVFFIIYKVFFWIVGSTGTYKDSLWVGYGGGRDFPFPMEQLMGATLCFGLLLLAKSFPGFRGAGGGKSAPAASPNGAFVPPLLNRIGLFVLPLIIIGLVWSLGVKSWPLILIAGTIYLFHTIAAARVRAESGLPSEHVTYELTRIPLIFGLGGVAGAKVMTLFIALAFLPISLLPRTFAQHLENMELARRFRISYGRIAVASIVAFFSALGIGMFSYLILSYYGGQMFAGVAGHPGERTSMEIAHYPLWVSHFTGEEGLDKFTQVHPIRMWFIFIGVAIFGVLTFLRGRFLKFPLHPIGYLIFLLSLFFNFISPYYRGAEGVDVAETSLIWGSALVAWLLKSLIIKYGGMNSYKAMKPFFIGLVVGSVFAIFAWNCGDLLVSLLSADGAASGGVFDWFTGKPPYSPSVY